MSGPQSIKALLRAQGVALGGSVRARMAKAIDDVLFVSWLSALANEDGIDTRGEQAAVMLFGIVSRDPSYRVPLWLELTFKRHAAAIHSAVANGHYRG